LIFVFRLIRKKEFHWDFRVLYASARIKKWRRPRRPNRWRLCTPTRTRWKTRRMALQVSTLRRISI